jgi:hypothetical protein
MDQDGRLPVERRSVDGPYIVPDTADSGLLLFDSQKVRRTKHSVQTFKYGVPEPPASLFACCVSGPVDHMMLILTMAQGPRPLPFEARTG